VPKPELEQLLPELTTSFSQGSRDFGPLLNATQQLVGESQANLGPTQELLIGLQPFLRTQLATSDDLRAWSRDLAGVIGQLRASDHDVRSLLTEGPPATDQVDDLAKLFRPGLRPMLDDLADAGRMLPTYQASIQQVLVIYPAIVAVVQTSASAPSADPGTFHMSLGTNFNEPPPCYAGFMPIDRARDLRIETAPASLPSDLYCKVAHGDPRDPRGARNTPCLNAPGVRAASVEECLGRPLGSMRRFATASPVPGR
jgi:phospholipid/cholesterol/gamma-HCH transport system substrate-binding protein